jgi:hypothetical protein
MRYVSMTSTEDVPAVWEDPDGDLVYASTPYLPVPASGLQATVEAVGTDTNCGVRRLAGWETGEGRGVVWDACPDSGSPPDWCSHLIRDLTGNPVSVTRQAFDLTESGFTAVLVSGWAQVGDPPTTCVAGEFVGVVVHRSDLDFDLAVGASDLAILLGSWTSGGSEVCAISRGDIDGDNDVDGTDLAILFGDWDSGPVFPAWPCSGLGCESASSSATAGTAGGGSDAVLAAITSLGFSSIAAFAAWADGAGTDERAAACAYLVAAIGEYEGGGQ